MSILADLYLPFMSVFFYFLPLFIVIFCSCTTTQQVWTLSPVSKVFYADYQKTWRATMLALEDYPIEVENNETGRLKTEPIQTGTIWKPPFKAARDASASKYTIHIKLVKGRIDSVPVVKAMVLKKIFVQKGFYE